MVVIMILTLLVRGAGAVVNVVEPTACLTAKTIASPLNDLKLATGRTTSYYFWVSDIFTMSSDTNSCDLSDFVCVPFYTPSDGTAAAYQTQDTNRYAIHKNEVPPYFEIKPYVWSWNGGNADTWKIKCTAPSTSSGAGTEYVSNTF